MNYTSQLRGWAVDRTIELAKVNGAKLTMPELQEQATALAAYAYVPDKDFKDSIACIVDILKSDPDALNKVNQLMQELGVLEEEMQRQLSVHNTTNGSATSETVQ